MPPKSFTQEFGIFLRFISYCSPILRKQYGLLTGSFLALLAQVVLQLLEPWPLKFIIDEVLVSNPKQTSSSADQFFLPDLGTLDPITVIILSAIALVIIVVLRALSTYFNKVGFALLGSSVLAEVRNMLYRRLQSLSLAFHTKASRGDLILRVMGDVSVLREVSVNAFLPMLGSTLIMLGMIVVMLWVNWQLALVALSTAPVFFFFAIRMTRQIKHVARKQRKREGLMARTTAESIGAIQEVQSLSFSDAFFDEFSHQSYKTLNQDVKARRLEAGLQRIVDILVATSTALVLGYGSILVLGNQLTLGELIVFMYYLTTAFKPVRNLAKYTGRLARASASCEHVLEVLERKPDVYDLQGAVKAPSFHGEVRFENVSFSYESIRPVLKNINFHIRPSQNIAIVGDSGSGKSTLMNLILRLYDCSEGRVIIDGHDIREFTLASLRGQVSLVQQDNQLFPTSVKDNIALSEDYNDDEIETAARLANAHEFIKALPNGYDTMLGDAGATLSKGQRQRIAIARAAIRRTPILILDEPTTGLDKENEREIIGAMELMKRGRTAFLVTHNLMHASRADLILFIENGQIVENGTHEELMQLNGRYAASYKIQEVKQVA